VVLTKETLTSRAVGLFSDVRNAGQVAGVADLSAVDEAPFRALLGAVIVVAELNREAGGRVGDVTHLAIPVARQDRGTDGQQERLRGKRDGREVVGGGNRPVPLVNLIAIDLGNCARANGGTGAVSVGRLQGRVLLQHFRVVRIADDVTRLGRNLQGGLDAAHAGDVRGGEVGSGDDVVAGEVGERGYLDSGGCSKILHKCDYDKEDHDLYFYCPKVSGSERNEGLQGRMDKKEGRETRGEMEQDVTTPANENNHPTLKPISLLVQILRLFKTPNDQVLLDPFMGSGSMAIAANKVGGFDYVGIELNPDYFAIAKERIAHAEHDLINMFG